MTPDNESQRHEDNQTLNDRLEFIDQKHERRVDQTIKPRLDDLETKSDDARNERAELFDLVQGLQQEVAILQERLDGLAGLADDQETNPQKRISDLRHAMIRRAEANEEAGRYPGCKMCFEDVADLMMDYGHGDLHRPQIYAAMRDARESPGFQESTMVNSNGNEVEATRLDLEELRAETACNEIITTNGASGQQNQTESVIDFNSD